MKLAKNNTNWHTPNPTFRANKNYTLTIVASHGYDSKITPRDNKLYIQQIRVVAIPPYEFDGYKVIKPISATIEKCSHDEYIATMCDTGIVASGENVNESISLLKEVIIYTYERYALEKRLGPEPLRQLKILEGYIGKRW